jgi:oligopeptidase B
MSSFADAQQARPTSRPIPPIAEKRTTIDTLHGDVRRDDYAWMRNKEDPALIKYLTDENAYTDAMMERTKPLQEQLYKEILGRIKETDEQVPVPDNGWYYYTRTEQGKAYPIYARKRSLDGKEEVYLDQNEEAKPHNFYQLGGMEVSPDGNFLAALVDTNGYEDFSLRVRDLRTNQWLPDRVEKLSWGLAWASDNKTVFYVSGDSAKRPEKVWRHVVGTPTSSDAVVFHEENVLFNVSIERARSGAFVFIQSGSFTQDEWRAIDASKPASAPVVIAPRKPGVEYAVEHGGDFFYITTNRDNAVNFKVMRAPVATPSAWAEFIPVRAAVFVEGIDVFREWMVRSERRDGLRRLVVRQMSNGEEHEVTFQDAAYGVFLEENPEFATTLLRFTYSSLITPPTVYDYDMSTRQRELKKQQEVLGGYDPTQYTVERRRATTWDGSASVPISIVYKKSVKKDRSNPLLLYAYGSYGATTEPTFNSARFSLIDRGFVYAIAHVRGGQEMGRSWYDNGKMLKKMNTFTDFRDVADFLIGEGYTSPARLVIHGGSAGGLLVGTVMNMNVEKYRAVVADVPFVDVINTMLDASIPLTAQEWEQWGNPNKRNEYRYMLQYSPYDNVMPKPYPSLLVMSGINDSRVAFWEPAKWVAKLRASNTSANPILLKMNMDSGHGGSSGRYDRYKETAFRYAFMLAAVGLAGGAQ